MSRLLPQATYLEPIVGWRCWRVLSMQTLSEGRRYRLCATGTFGVPKVWEPRAAVVAQCSSFKSRHEAPHRSHDCGLYAYESQVEAERKFVDMWSWNARPGTTWAFGRVSLWGRLIECELGWRAQYAYPFDVTVFTDGKAATSIAREYAIDVDQKRLSDLRALIRRHPVVDAEPMVKTISGWYRKKWYDTSIYGGMDEVFLKPYHEAVCRRFDELSASIARLEKSLLVAKEEGGDHA